ncbi:MAG: NADH-quinone oxidoreductase subunit N [Chloroflexota bacterium]
MTPADLTALLPLIILAATPVVVLLVIAFRRSHLLTLILTLLGLLLAFVPLFTARSGGPQNVMPLLVIDGYALFYVGLLVTVAFAAAVLAYPYLKRHTDRREEFYVLLLLATLGAAVLAASNHFASFFLGLEILSVALYVLVAYRREDERSIEGGFKYLVLAATSAAFLLLGMALVYAQQGTMAFDRLVLQPTPNLLLLVGLGLILVGIGFKLALVPFHMWAPDVYEGAPAPAATLIATVSKGSVVAVFLRLFVPADIGSSPTLFWALSAVAIASMFGGNLLALAQNNVKRILAYSSIAHLGYVLVGFLAGGAQAVAASTFYVVTYLAATLAAFGVVGALSNSRRDADAIEDYHGLYWRRPWLAAVLTVALFSLAGIPLTAGFLGKLYVLLASVGAGLWPLAVSLVASSVIGLYYYLRVIVAMFAQPEAEQGVSPTHPLPSVVEGGTLGVLAVLLVGLGVYPTPIIRLIEAMVANLI